MTSTATLTVYEGCMPIEVMAARGGDIILRPAAPGRLAGSAHRPPPLGRCAAARRNAARTLYNLVGFQTNLKWGEQKRVFSMIPGLEHAEFVRYGVMHRNTFLESPRVLTKELYLKEHPNVFFAGQITGFEGYMESAASGLLAARNLHAFAGRRAAPAAHHNHVWRAARLYHHPQQGLPAHGCQHGHSAAHRGDRRHPR